MPSEGPMAGLERLVGRTWPHLEAARQHSTEARERLRAALVEHDSADVSIVAFGSLARGEFSDGSDVDWTLLVDGFASPNHFEMANAIGRKIKAVVDKDPGPEGNFGTMVFSHDLVHRIGGEDDSNKNTTRRCLMLLESIPLGRDDAHERVMRSVLQRYILEDHTFAKRRAKYHVPRFLLNDFARYWRTMAVDFAYKQRTRRGKGAVLRNLKLRFSRKLLFASALVACFSCQLTMGPKANAASECALDEGLCVACLREFLRQTPLEMLASALLLFVDRGAKIEEVCSVSAQIFDAYDAFVGVLSDGAQRKRLEDVSAEDFDTAPLVVDLRKHSRAFRDGLLGLFFDLDAETRELTRFYGVF